MATSRTQPKSQNSLTWSQFNGLADSLWSGIVGSLYKCVGLDIHSQRGSITPQQAMAKDSGTTITELCKVSLVTSKGYVLWFSSTSGKIWSQSGGVYTLVYTTSPSSGGAGCLGAEEFDGNIYWATSGFLHYTANTDTAFGSVTANWQQFSAGDSYYHPMETLNNALFIGDGHLVAKVDSSQSFTANILDFTVPNIVKCMLADDIDLLIGTQTGESGSPVSSVGFCYIVEWDTIQTSWQFMELVWENGVNCLFYDGSVVVANAGQYGKLYYYSAHFLKPYKRIPGSQWNPSNNGEILPNAAAMWNGMAVFGFSADNGNPCDQAIYTLGSYDSDYEAVINEDFPISTGDVNGITIGAICVSGQIIYASWFDSNSGTYGVDKLSYSAKFANAYLETPVIDREDDTQMTTTYEKMFAFYQSMPSGCSISFQYYQNWGNLTTPANSSETDTLLQTVEVQEAIDARVFRMRINFVVSGNTAPVLEIIGVAPAAQQQKK